MAANSVIWVKSQIKSRTVQSTNLEDVVKKDGHRNVFAEYGDSGRRAERADAKRQNWSERCDRDGAARFFESLSETFLGWQIAFGVLQSWWSMKSLIGRHSPATRPTSRRCRQHRLQLKAANCHFLSHVTPIFQSTLTCNERHDSDLKYKIVLKRVDNKQSCYQHSIAMIKDNKISI